MEGIRNFLESSTIHGLTYISTTRRYARLFWILIVITGFSVSGYLIQQSFQAWAESPIKTTIMTRPISEIKFPKVTVCPPKNTFTDLNYDLMLVENMTLTEEKRKEMVDEFDKILNEHVFMDDFNKIYEDNRYYNWYHGLSKLEEEVNYSVKLMTSATSGMITTNFFGENFDIRKVATQNTVNVYLLIPKNIALDKNVTLNFNAEVVSLADLPYTSRDQIFVQDNNVVGTYLDPAETKYFRNFTPPMEGFIEQIKNQGIEITFRVFGADRSVSYDDLQLATNKKMPGFKFSWHYSGENFKAENYETFTDSPFIRKVNF